MTCLLDVARASTSFMPGNENGEKKTRPKPQQFLLEYGIVVVECDEGGVVELLQTSHQFSKTSSVNTAEGLCMNRVTGKPAY